MTRASPAARAGRRSLQRLARLHGVHSIYRGTDGRRHAASDDVLVAVLGALGVPLSSAAEAGDALRATMAERQGQVMEPVLVHRSGASVATEVRLDGRTDPEDVWLTVHREDGEIERRRLVAAGARLVGASDHDGSARYHHRVRLRRAALPPGYHRLELEGPGVHSTALVVSAPARLPAAARQWGVSVPLHALRSRTDWGVGSYRDLARFADWVAEHGGALAGTLPLYPAYLDAPAPDPSPYLPVSRLAWSELYLDVESLPEVSAVPGMAEQLASPALRDQLFRLRRSPLSHPGAVMALKRRLVEPMALALRAADPAVSPRRAAFDAFIREHPELPAYARFRAEREAGVGAGPDALEAAVAYHLYVQWAADTQLGELASRAGRGCGLYLDLPVGVHPQGFDPWHEPGAFLAGVSGGAPPDDFNTHGQSWGFPPLHPEGVRAQGYRYVAAMFRHAMRHAAALRIDHVMGLHRLYCVPDGMDARDGAYVGYHADELHAVLTLEAGRAGTVVVGEDLGTVPTSVERAMARDRLLGSHVLQFESTVDDPFPEAPRRALASFGTHDLPPFASYWRGLDIGDRRRRDLVDPPGAAAERERRARWRAAVLAALPGPGLAALPADADAAEERRALIGFLRHLAAGAAEVAMVDLEDLWLETEPQNRPGTGPEAGNFRRRAARTLDDAAADPELSALLREIDDRRQPALGGADAATGTNRTTWGGSR